MRAPRAAVVALLVLGALLLALAWGLGQVVGEAQAYAVTFGLPADTSRDEAGRVVALGLGCASLLAAVLVHARPARSPLAPTAETRRT